MGAIKSYYHEEICEMQSDPQADQPNPQEEEWIEAHMKVAQVNKWWAEQDKDSTWIKEQEGDYRPEDEEKRDVPF